MKPQQSEDNTQWEERFDERFVYTHYPFLGAQHDSFKQLGADDEGRQMTLIGELKQFFHQEIESVKQQTAMEIMEMIDPFLEEAHICNECGFWAYHATWCFEDSKPRPNPVVNSNKKLFGEFMKLKDQIKKEYGIE